MSVQIDGKHATHRDAARIAEIFRERVALFLRASTPHPVTYRSIRDPLDLQRAEHGDIRGIPDLTILTRTGRSVTLGEALSAAEDAAHADSNRLAAVIVSRSATEIGEAFACLSLSDFADLVTATQRSDTHDH